MKPFNNICGDRDGWRNRLAEYGVTSEVTTDLFLVMIMMMMMMMMMMIMVMMMMMMM